MPISRLGSFRDRAGSRAALGQGRIATVMGLVAVAALMLALVRWSVATGRPWPLLLALTSGIPIACRALADRSGRARCRAEGRAFSGEDRRRAGRLAMVQILTAEVFVMACLAWIRFAR